MHSRLSPRSYVAIIGVVLMGSSNLGQSLSVSQKPDSSFWVQMSAPAGGPYTLQTTANLHLWIDKQNDVPDQASFLLDHSYASARYFRLVPTQPDPSPTRVMLLGDSMVAECCGWGLGMPTYFKPSATVLNYAQAWTSSKVFFTTAEYDKMLLVKPNYVLMQFCYSDIGADPDRSSTPEEFTSNLQTLVQTIRGWDGVPILITLHAARVWDANGNLIPTDHPYNTIIRQVSANLKTPLVDLYKITFELFSKLGKSGCAFMTYDPNNPEDGLHVSPAGAVYVAQVIAQYLPDALGPYMVGVLDPPPIPAP
jgi:lysophospholipase L1-like esterase